MKTTPDARGDLPAGAAIGNTIVLSDNLEFTRTLNDGIAQLIYIDPPFNTGRRQVRAQLKTVRDERGDRTGYNGRRYKTTKLGATGYDDCFDDFQSFLRPRLLEARRLLSGNGAFFLHIDYREAHYCKVALDAIFGRACFMNEIIWAYDYGARSKKRWSAKHDTIFWYVKDPKNYVFNYEQMARIPYMAPGLVGPEKAARGKTPTDVWWHTIVSPNGKEKTGYATQKPLGVLERIVKIHSNENDLVIDFFAGSGTTGEAAAKNNRWFLLVDSNPDAIRAMKNRLRAYSPKMVNFNASEIKPALRGQQMNEETENFLSVAETLQREHVNGDDLLEWQDSPYAWIKNITSPGKKGAIGKKLVAGWCTAMGMNVCPAPGGGADRVVEGQRVKVKLSIKWAEGNYTFQQIRNENYDYLICLGITPAMIHCWVLSKEDVLREWKFQDGLITSQHTGERGKETAWFSVNPQNPSSALNNYGGSLVEAFSIIQRWRQTL